MNPVFGARRRAEEFHSMLEGTTPSTGELPDARLAELLATVATLRQATPPPARPEFVSDLRSRLMLAAEGALAPVEGTATARSAPVRKSPRERRIAAAVGGFAIVSATASMAVAAQTALPGDTLYPLKRAIENAHAGVQGSADDKGHTLLDSASGRLEEVDELSRADDRDAAVIAQTLDDFVSQASEASDLLLSDYASTGHTGSIQELRTFTAASIEALQQLQDLIPTEVRGSLISATEAVRRIDEQAMSLCPACSDLPLTQVPDFAAKSLSPILEDLVQHPTRTSPPREQTTPPPAKTTEPESVGQPAKPPVVAPSTAPTDPAEDEQPVLPSGPKGTGGGHHGGSDEDPLAPITTGASNDDPLGNLVSGAGDLVDDLLGGGTGH